MRKILILLLIISFSTISAQTLETIGAGVAEFLLSSPSTVDKMSSDQRIALSLIGGLLDRSGQRKHDTNVATAGKTQISLNTDSGQQIQLAMDTNGNVFALSNGIIYPIGSNVVNQAKEYVLNQQPGYMDYVNKSNSNMQLILPDYNVTVLRNTWNKENVLNIIPVEYHKKPYTSDILNKYDVNVEDLFIKGKKGPIFLYDDDFYDKYINNKKHYNKRMGKLSTAIWGEEGNLIEVQTKRPLTATTFSLRQLYIVKVSTHRRGVFTSRWYSDINSNNQLEFDEFQDIRRNFYQYESFMLTFGLFSHHNYYSELKIFEQASGKMIYSDNISKNDTEEGMDSGYFSFLKDYFNPGIYTYYITLIREDTGEELCTFIDKFQILSSENVNKKDKVTFQSTNTPTKNSAINELIQLLKEGKISEETFKISMEALDNQ